MNVALIIVMVVLIDAFVIGAIFYGLIGGQFRDLARRYPARTPREGSVRRDFQSIRLGMINLGGCVHLEVDEDALHVHPTAFLRWLRAPGFSVPWDQVRSLKDRGAQILVRLGSGPGAVEMSGPRWCLELAGGGPGTGDETERGS